MSCKSKGNFIIYPNVKLGKNCVIEDFVVIGVLPCGHSKNGPLVTRIGNNAVIRSHTVIYAGNIIGDNFQTGNKANIRECNQIGNDVSIGTMSIVEHHVKIGNKARVHSQVFIPEYSVLEDECWIGPGVVFTNAKYPKSPNAKNELKGPRICKNAKIGARCTLLPNVVVGENSLVGAGSLITKNIKKNVLAFGTPAKTRKKIQSLNSYNNKGAQK